MINLRKLASLPEGTRQRKTVLIIRNFEASIAYGELIDSSFLKDLLRLIQEDDAWIEEIKEQASHISGILKSFSLSFHLPGTQYSQAQYAECSGKRTGPTGMRNIHAMDFPGPERSDPVFADGCTLMVCGAHSM